MSARDITGLVVGMVLLAVGAQGGIRLLVDHDNAGVLGWTPGGSGVRLACYALMAVAGALLARWASEAAKKSGTGV
ncbi:hypothetical protein E1265_06820 [Streptomyces sp. 8K308]|uniref:hypothetical protein n=1 Tax=Streptomyces sp. 8K308 TaxID=2530388 RepID=UPI001049781B|nr:hypothetical protein [Streptomyces sp. 8K308]TDC25570.1 hypothetical protein E1265_06820 [Streptomyces sp. 8K308]